MPSKYASGKYAIAQCDRCDERYMLKDLKIEIIKTHPYNLKVCKSCWDPDQPQLQLGLYPVNDPQAVREPRPDVSYLVSGNSGLQINLTGIGVDGGGTPSEGSRVIQWGWNPVGFNTEGLGQEILRNTLLATGQVGTVTITTN